MSNDDINVRGILLFLVILVLMLVLAFLVVTAMSRHLETDARQKDEVAQRQTPSASLAAGQPYFPAPREQSAPLVDLQTLRAQEDTQLNSYGWIDASNGVVRIPIDRAIELLTQNPERRP